MVSFYLSLGANIGDRLENLQTAIQLLQQEEGIQLTRVSSIYETEPVGYVDQPSFLNMVIGGITTLAATDLLHTVLKIEQQLGRIREVRWGPRTIDIDVLVYGKETIDQGDLQVPHPRMTDRLFVLIPLEEIAPDLNIPVENQGIFQTPKQLLEKWIDKSGVRKWKNINWEIELEHSES